MANQYGMAGGHSVADDPELDERTVVRLAEIVSTLETVSEQIGDVSIDVVRSAIEAGGGRPTIDRTLARARRSVDKAAGLLEAIHQ